ncbi:MAG: metal ABC transporter ATP-binding protein [Streptosporangiales bacterium]
MPLDHAPVLRLADASFGYDGAPVLTGVNLQLHAGEVMALLGANGSGKSTLVKGALGLLPLLAGQLELFGVPARRFREHGRIGYVPQRHTVVGAVPSSVREVVTSGRLARGRRFGPPSRADRAAVRAALHGTSLEEIAQRPVSALSGGQQRRVLVARALAAEPEVLVMDEPMAGVDTPSQQLLADLLHELVRERGVTLLVVAHELGSLGSLVDRAVVLETGRVVHDGGPDTEAVRRYGALPHLHHDAPEPAEDAGVQL